MHQINQTVHQHLWVFLQAVGQLVSCISTALLPLHQQPFFLAFSYRSLLSLLLLRDSISTSDLSSHSEEPPSSLSSETEITFPLVGRRLSTKLSNPLRYGYKSQVSFFASSTSSAPPPDVLFFFSFCLSLVYLDLRFENLFLASSAKMQNRSSKFFY